MSNPAVSSASPLAALLQQRLSPERLSPYEGACARDVNQAVALYEWNAGISAAFHEVLGLVEVLLRNAMHDELVRWHARKGTSGQWYDDKDGVLETHRRQEISTVRFWLGQAHKTESPGRVVADLTFGFWRYLLARRYESTLWTPALRHAFPNLRPARRETLYRPVDSLVQLRNRIAHHEPIYNRPLASLHSSALRIAGCIDSDLESWVSTRSRVPDLLGVRPLPRAR